MISVILGAALGVNLTGCILILVRGANEELRHLAYGLLAVGSWMVFAADALTSDRLWAGFQGTLALIYTWLWWRGRRNGRGKRIAKELGAKSRARIEALARRLVPAPGGAS